MGTDNATVGRRYLTEIWGKGKREAIDELVDKDIVIRDTMGTDLRGTDKFEEMLRMMQASFSDNSFTVDDVIVAGDRVVVRATWKGTHTGDFFGFKGTGRVLEGQSVDILRIRNGKVVEDLGFMDSYSMFQQLGVLPDRDKLAKTAPQAAASPPGPQAQPQSQPRRQ